MPLFEPSHEPSDQSTAGERGSNVSGGLRKIAMAVAIGGLAYLALRRSRSESRAGGRIRNRVAATVETREIRTDGATDSGQPEPGGVGVPSSASDGDSGSVEAPESAAETDAGGGEPAETEPTDESGPTADELIGDESADGEPVEGAETAVDEVDDAHEHPTEPGTMDVGRDVVEEAIDDGAVDDANEPDDDSEA